MASIEEELIKTGLTGNETKAYMQLLESGELSANEIAKKIIMDRTLAYTVLNHLIEKGLVTYVIRENKKFFKASDPLNLLNSVKEKEALINNLITKIKSIKKQEKIEQEINVYEGKDGIRSIFNIMLKYNEFCSWGATGRAYDLFYQTPAIVKEAEKKGFVARIITSSKYKGHPMTDIKTVKIRYLDIKSEATTSIFGDYILIHIIKQNPLAILIKNKEIAETYQNHFEILWKSAKP